MSNYRKGVIPSQDSIDKRRETMVGWRNTNISKEVHKYSLTGHYISSYNSMIDAKLECKCDVYNAVSGRNTTSGGFLWRSFKVDYLFTDNLQ